MSILKSAISLFSLLFFLGLSSPLLGTTYSYNFQNPPNTNVGNTHSFDTNPISTGVLITAYGFRAGGTGHTADLFTKFTSGDPAETGLGINDPSSISNPPNEHEINSSDFVQLNLTNLLLKNIGSITITLGSLQLNPAEDARIFASSAAGVTPGASILLATLLPTASELSSFTFSPSLLEGDKFITVQAFVPVGGNPAADTLITSLVATTAVPEPTTYLILGSFLGLGMLLNAKRKAVKVRS